MTACFITVCILLSIRPGAILYGLYRTAQDKVFPHLPVTDKVLGGCEFCTAFWVGVAIHLAAIPLYGVGWWWATTICANAVLSRVILAVIDFYEKNR